MTRKMAKSTCFNIPSALIAGKTVSGAPRGGVCGSDRENRPMTSEKIAAIINASLPFTCQRPQRRQPARSQPTSTHATLPHTRTQK